MLDLARLVGPGLGVRISAATKTFSGQAVVDAAPELLPVVARFAETGGK
jgi:hypothetical protein